MTREVSKFVKSSSVKDLHPLNIYIIDSTKFVLKLDIFKYFNFEQDENTPSIDLILEVSKLDKSNEVNDSHPSNI